MRRPGRVDRAGFFVVKNVPLSGVRKKHAISEGSKRQGGRRGSRNRPTERPCRGWKGEDVVIATFGARGFPCFFLFASVIFGTIVRFYASFCRFSNLPAPLYRYLQAPGFGSSRRRFRRPARETPIPPCGAPRGRRTRKARCSSLPPGEGRQTPAAPGNGRRPRA